MQAQDAAAPTVAVCPVPHAPNQPLPPGHPETNAARPSSLKPPSGEHCIFFRAADDAEPGAEADGEKIKQPLGPTPTVSPAFAAHPDSLLVLSSRSSELARLQAEQVADTLSSRYGSNSPAFTGGEHDTHLRDLLAQVTPEGSEPKPMSFPIQTMSTAGDVNLRSPLYVIGGEGRAIWTKELEVALREGVVDAIVHCAKDVPTTLPDGLELAAILEREDPRDALVVKADLPYKALAEMPPGSVIGTSSVRRVALLRRVYPHLVFSDVRGNINTRLAKLDAEGGPYTALVLAAAGLKRLSLEKRITAYLTAPEMLYSVGQGSLAIEVRTPPPGADPRTNRDARVHSIISSLGNWRATLRCAAERALLRRMEGGCSIPLGVETEFCDHGKVERQKNEHLCVPAELDGSMYSRTLVCDPNVPCEGRELTLRAVIVSLDGTQRCEHTETRRVNSIAEAVALGCLVADKLEHEQGARAILDEVEHHRRMAEEADNRRRALREGASHEKEIDRRGLPRDDGQPKAWEV
ncbi:hydroxymethylbilane synthase [Malassezia cuniculi]|uniref:hydroxymethylbilane synthase n=1 Tax=Malassezia cuniculi TaxID=948313 RepID=A0AAF0J6X8_9BASI|nr:hydroxymethylbilane synthase [Malassezia cuniculi]